MKNRILNRGILEWANLLFAIVNIIIVTRDIYNGGVWERTLLNALVAGMCFTTWLWGGMVNTREDMVRRLESKPRSHWGRSE